ncbi:Arc family DNA-binding protein [Devosia alba]|uniref:Arc family DNA-binding protein n=1 Tax=Devosia alba TaxID=3152360 RepID=UPI0032631CF3
MSRTDTSVLIAQAGQQFKARLPDDLHQRIKDAASANNRSANAEIVSRLEASFQKDAGALDAGISRLIAEHVEQEVKRRMLAVAAQIGGAA